jgi:hypothetical protein
LGRPSTTTSRKTAAAAAANTAVALHLGAVFILPTVTTE